MLPYILIKRIQKKVKKLNCELEHDNSTMSQNNATTYDYGWYIDCS